MLKLDHATLTQGTFRLEADVTFAAGKVTALMGASGSGKSTLLAGIAGFLPLSRGRILVDGVDVAGLAPGDRPFSMLFQDQNLFPHLSVAQNVGLGLRPDLRLTSDQSAARDDVLTQVGLGGMGDRLPRELSGGQQSRAALARALLRGRPWLLLDEPFSALGPALRADMLALLRDMALAQGLSVLIVTHAPEDARMAADETSLVADGIVQAPRETAGLFADPPQALRDYLG